MSNQSEGGTDRFVYDEPCDEPECDATPTAYIGDIYYACPDHAGDFEELIQ